MEVNVEIDQNKINEAVTQAIIESAIGEEMRREIKAYLESAKAAYNNPIKGIIARVVQEEIYKLIVTEWREPLMEEIRKQFTEQVLSEVVSKTFQTIMDNKYR